MIGDLKAAASTLAIKAPDLKAGSGKALEAEMVFELALAATHHGQVVARTHKGFRLRRNQRFRLRGGPGRLWDPDAGGAGPHYFALTIDGAEFELHNSLEFVGSSQVEHEMDVSAVWRAAADEARYAPDRKIAGPPVIGIELKEYGVGKTIDKNLVRAFFACIVDFIPAWAVSVLTFGGRGGLQRTYVASPRSKDQFWFLTTGWISGPAKDLGAAYDIRVLDHLETLKFKVAVTVMAARLRDLAQRPLP
jgi:hypothetical protein